MSTCTRNMNASTQGPCTAVKYEYTASEYENSEYENLKFVIEYKYRVLQL